MVHDLGRARTPKVRRPIRRAPVFDCVLGPMACAGSTLASTTCELWPSFVGNRVQSSHWMFNPALRGKAEFLQALAKRLLALASHLT